MRVSHYTSGTCRFWFRERGVLTKSTLRSRRTKGTSNHTRHCHYFSISLKSPGTPGRLTCQGSVFAERNSNTILRLSRCCFRTISGLTWEVVAK